MTDYYRLVDTAEDQLSQQRYQEAIVNLRKAVAMQPREAVVRNSLGVALARSGRPEEAIRQYRELVALSPDFPDAHGNLGAALLKHGQRRRGHTGIRTGTRAQRWLRRGAFQSRRGIGAAGQARPGPPSSAKGGKVVRGRCQRRPQSRTGIVHDGTEPGGDGGRPRGSQSGAGGRTIAKLAAELQDMMTAYSR